jgi:hypothetical protein
LHFLPFMEAPLLRPWLHAAFLAFVVCMVMLIAASLVTVPTSARKLEATTLSSWGQLLAGGRTSRLADYRLWLSIMVLAAAGMWYMMR